MSLGQIPVPEEASYQLCTGGVAGDWVANKGISRGLGGALARRGEQIRAIPPRGVKKIGGSDPKRGKMGLKPGI